MSRATAYRPRVIRIAASRQAPRTWRSVARPALFGTVALILIGLAAVDWARYIAQPDHRLVAVDFVLYRDAATRWLSGGPFYLPHQLAGPYEVTAGDILYPPYDLPLFVAFTILPAWLWWLLPIGGTTAVIMWHRPRVEAWPLLALCLWFPATSVKILSGNPVLWAVFAVALGTVWRWPGAFALVKPSLFPFALLGSWRRSWWVALIAICVVSLAFAPMWPDFVRVLRNARQDGGLLYSIQEAPMMAMPIVAWVGGRWWSRRE